MEMTVGLTELSGFAVNLWLHTEVDPSDKEWDAAIERILAYSRTKDFKGMRMLIVSDGGAPSVRQRNFLSQAPFRGEKSKSACVTKAVENPIKRGIATAISWMNPSFGFFPPSA